MGKTTTIAKLAAYFKLRERKSVGLITIDTYRIAAVQQLQTIADIIQVPLVTVLTVGDLKEALDDLRHYDLVLVDTAGRSQSDEMKMFDLDAFLKAAAPDETHLVVSAAASLGNMSEVVERFTPLGPTRRQTLGSPHARHRRYRLRRPGQALAQRTAGLCRSGGATAHPAASARASAPLCASAAPRYCAQLASPCAQSERRRVVAAGVEAGAGRGVGAALMQFGLPRPREAPK